MRNPEQMTMVERIGLILAQRKYGDVGWDDMPEHAQDDFLDAARAALSALREPTEEMVRAGETVVDNQFDPWDPGKFLGVDDAWRAMVGAALTEGKHHADG